MKVKSVTLLEEGFPHLRLFEDKSIMNDITGKTLMPRGDYFQTRDSTRKQVYFNLDKLCDKYFHNSEIDQVDAKDKVNLYFMGFPNYTVTRDGRVWSHHLRKWMVPQKNLQGYLHVGLNFPANERCNRKNKQQHAILHRLIATAFLPNPENYPDVDHLDGNKENNAASNLEWVSTRENLRRAREKGLRKSSITDAQVHELCRMIKEGKRSTDIAKALGVTKHVVHHIRCRGSHIEIAKLYGIYPTSNMKFRTPDYSKIYKDRKARLLNMAHSE